MTSHAAVQASARDSMPHAVIWRDPAADPLTADKLLVDDFVGARADMVTDVLVRAPAGNTWQAAARLIRVRPGMLPAVWEASYTMSETRSRPDGMDTPSASGQPGRAPQQTLQSAMQHRPLAEIVAEATGLPGWTPTEIDTSYDPVGGWTAQIKLCNSGCSYAESGRNPESADNEPF